MNAPTTTPRLHSGAADADGTGDPPSLRRRAPARVDIALKSGRALSITWRGVHVFAGRPFVLRVVPQGISAIVEIAAEPPLQTIVPTNRVDDGVGPTYHAEFSGQLHSRFIPIPSTGKLYVSVLDRLPNPCRITIPIAIWPSYWTLLLWWILAFVSLVGLRLQRIVANNESFQEILEAMNRDLPIFLGLFALGFLVLIPLRLIGWLVLFAGTGDSNE